MIKSEIVAHSLNQQGDEIISVLCTFPRIILAEVNTHRMLSKNTSSSRAIPFNKMLEAIEENPFIPIAWQQEHSGMQGSEYFTDERDIQERNDKWLQSCGYAIENAKSLHNDKVTKQLANRLLEPFMWTTMLITGSREGWENFFSLRCPQYSFGSNTTTPKIWKSRKDAVKDFPDWISRNDFYWNTINKGQAEIHMMALAECIWDAVNESTPKVLKSGEWHIPFEKAIVNSNNWIDFCEKVRPEKEFGDDWENVQDLAIKSSVAMAARTSYTIVGEEKGLNYENLISLHDRLLTQDPPHSSPMEHCARVMSDDEYYSYVKGTVDAKIDADGFINIEGHTNLNVFGWCYNLKGFIPYRYFVDNGLVI